MLGFALYIATRFPRAADALHRIGQIVKRHWKIALAVIAVVGGIWWFTNWRGDLIATHDAAGYSRAQAEYSAAIDEANERERKTQGRLDQMVVAFNGLAAKREQAINLTVKPIIEGIRNEVASDPRYRECAVSGSMLDNLNAGRSVVDAGLDASDPGRD